MVHSEQGSVTKSCKMFPENVHILLGVYTAPIFAGPVAPLGVGQRETPPSGFQNCWVGAGAPTQ